MDLTITPINDILTLILPGYTATGGTPSLWRLRPDVNPPAAWNRAASLAAYQDCSELQLVSCSKAGDTKDPFLNTAWDDNTDCNSLQMFDIVLRSECNGIFGTTAKTFEPSQHTLNGVEFPLVLNKSVIVTFNKGSVFYGSYNKFDKSEIDASNFAWHTDLAGADNLELEAPKSCDSPKMNDVRYLVLRAFGCSGKFIDNSNNICNSKTLFNDDKDDKTPYADPDVRNSKSNLLKTQKF